MIESNRSSSTCTVTPETSAVTDFSDDIATYPRATQFSVECKSGSETNYEIRYRTTDAPSTVTKEILSAIKGFGWGEISETDLSLEYDTYEYHNLIDGKKKKVDHMIGVSLTTYVMI